MNNSDKIKITMEEADTIGLALVEDYTNFVIKTNKNGYYLPQLTIYHLDEYNGITASGTIKEKASPLMYNVYLKTNKRGKYFKTVKPKGDHKKYDKWYLTGNIAINLLVFLYDNNLIPEGSKIYETMEYIKMYQETQGMKLTPKLRQRRDEIIAEINNINQEKIYKEKFIFEDSINDLSQYKQADGSYRFPEDEYKPEYADELGEYAAEKTEGYITFIKIPEGK